MPLAALRRNGIDVAHSIIGGVAGLQSLSTRCRCGFTSPSNGIRERSWQDRRVRLTASLAIDRESNNQALALGRSKTCPRTSSATGRPCALHPDRARARPRSGSCRWCRYGGYCDMSAAAYAQARLDNLQMVSPPRQTGASRAAPAFLSIPGASLCDGCGGTPWADGATPLPGKGRAPHRWPQIRQLPRGSRGYRGGVALGRRLQQNLRAREPLMHAAPRAQNSSGRLAKAMR
jgi:hypothetical protein